MQRELPTKIDWAMFGVTKDNTAFDGMMGFTNNIVYVVAYDTKKMSEADMPKTWDQLLDPKYKDKMTGSLFLMPRMISALSMKWGKDKALDFARKLKDTGILLTRAPRESILQSGERVIAAGEVDVLPKLWAKGGMPVKYVIPSPVVLGQFGSTVLAKAPHPNAARLLAGWLASKEGKKARETGQSRGRLSAGLRQSRGQGDLRQRRAGHRGHGRGHEGARRPLQARGRHPDRPGEIAPA